MSDQDRLRERRRRARAAGDTEHRSPVMVQEGSVSASFAAVVREMRAVIESTGHEAPVDLELSFESLAIDQSGIPLFTRDRNESRMTLKLATRIEGTTADPSEP